MFPLRCVKTQYIYSRFTSFYKQTISLKSYVDRCTCFGKRQADGVLGQRAFAAQLTVRRETLWDKYRRGFRGFGSVVDSPPINIHPWLEEGWGRH